MSTAIARVPFLHVTLGFLGGSEGWFSRKRNGMTQDECKQKSQMITTRTTKLVPETFFRAWDLVVVE